MALIGTSQQNTIGLSINVPKPAGTLDGHHVTLCATSDDITSTIVWPTGFVESSVTPLDTAVNDAQRFRVATKIANGEPANWNITSSVNIKGMSAVHSGRSTVTPVHRISGRADTTNRPSPWTGTSSAFSSATTLADCDIIFLQGDDVAPNAAVVHTAPAGFTLRQEHSGANFEQGALFTKEGAAAGETGVYSSIGTLAGGQANLAIVVIALAPSAPPPYVRLLWPGGVDRILWPGTAQYVLQPGSATSPPVTGYTLTAQTGVFGVTGVNAILARGLKALGQTGAFVESGINSNLSRGLRVTGQTGLFTELGIASNLIFAHKLLAQIGAFVLTGRNANLVMAHKLLAQIGAFSELGINAILIYGHRGISQPGVFLLTGSNASLIAARRLQAGIGVFSELGKNSSLILGRKISGVSAAYLLTGIAANLRAALILHATTGVFTETGISALLKKGPVLSGLSASYVLLGKNSTLRYNRVVQGQRGIFTESGINAFLAKGFHVIASTGVFTELGKNSTLRYNRVLQGQMGAYALIGPNVLLTVHRVHNDYVVTALPGAYVMTASAAMLRKTSRLIAQTGVFVETGKDAQLRRQLLLHALTGSFAFTPTSAALRKAFRLLGNQGSFLLGASNALLTRQAILYGGTGVFDLTGFAAEMKIIAGWIYFAEAQAGSEFSVVIERPFQKYEVERVFTTEERLNG